MPTPWGGNSHTGDQTGAQLATVAHLPQVFDGPIIDDCSVDRVTSQVVNSPQQIEGFDHTRLIVLRFKERQRLTIGYQGLGDLPGVE